MQGKGRKDRHAMLSLMLDRLTRAAKKERAADIAWPDRAAQL